MSNELRMIVSLSMLHDYQQGLDFKLPSGPRLHRVRLNCFAEVPEARRYSAAGELVSAESRIRSWHCSACRIRGQDLAGRTARPVQFRAGEAPLRSWKVIYKSKKRKAFFGFVFSYSSTSRKIFRRQRTSFEGISEFLL